MCPSEPTNPESYPNIIVTVPDGNQNLTVNTSTTNAEIIDPNLYPQLNIAVSTTYPNLIINPAPDIVIGSNGGSNFAPGGQGPPGPQGNTGPTGPQGNTGATGEESLWTNANPTLVTVGGLPLGSTLLGFNAIQILEEILYPYQPVSFSSFSVDLGGYELELNQPITGDDYTCSWTTSGPNENWVVGSLSVVRTVNGGSSTTLLSGLDYNDSPQSISHPTYQYNVPTNLAFTITGQQDEQSAPTSTETYSWKYKMYWGLTSGASITNFSNFSSEFITSTSTSSRLFTGNGTQQYFYFVIPNSFTSYTSFKNVLNNLSIPFQAAQTVTVTNPYGSSIQYKYYRSTNSSASTVTILPSIS